LFYNARLASGGLSMKSTTLLIFAAALLAPTLAPADDYCKTVCPEQIVVFLTSIRAGLPKAEVEDLRAAVEQEVNTYARQMPGWKCVCKIHEGKGFKCGEFPLKLTVQKTGDAIDAYLTGTQGEGWTAVASSQVMINTQSLADLASLKQAAVSAVEQTLSKVHPCGAWSGTINYVIDVTAPDINEQMRNYTGHGRYETTVFLNRGIAGVTRSANVKSDLVLRQRARAGGATTIIQSGTDKIEGSANGSSPATVDVAIRRDSGTYQIVPSWLEAAAGSLHRVTCDRENCTTHDENFDADQARQMAIVGKLEDPNHLHGTKTEQTSIMRDSINGAQTLTITWDLTKSSSDTH